MSGIGGSSLGSDRAICEIRGVKREKMSKKARIRRLGLCFTVADSVRRSAPPPLQQDISCSSGARKSCLVLCRRACRLNDESDAAVFLPAFFGLFPTNRNFFAVANG